MKTRLMTRAAIAALALTTLSFAATSQAAGIRSGSMLGNTCAGCHGTNGASAGDAMPSIAGMDKGYFVDAMEGFKDGTRPSTIMGRIARGYSDQEIETLAAFFSRLPWYNAPAKFDKKLAAAGKKIHKKSCNSCHKKGGADGKKGTPRLSGQWPDYTYTQLTNAHDPKLGYPQPKKMKKRIEKLSEADLKALAHYYASHKK